jgi:hypothetical protein
VGFSWGFLGGGGAEWRLTPPETAPSDKTEGNMSCDAFNRLKNRLENAFGYDEGELLCTSHDYAMWLVDGTKTRDQ